MDSIKQSLSKKSAYDKKLTDYVEELRKRSNIEMVRKFSEFRKFSTESMLECGVFYIGEMTEMLIPSFIEDVVNLGVISPTNLKPIFNNRYVIPIYNENKLVQNLVGYSREANERYIYGTSKYYRRKETLWGLENLGIAYEMGYAILTEGITDAIRLRDMGYKNSFAMCGTHQSSFIMRQLNRCRHGVIRIPDRDDAGKRALKSWDVNRHLTIHVNFKYKDIDEMCSESIDNQEWFNSYMRGCIDWILSEAHKGQKCICEEVTIL